ncbi:MAG: heavy metal translocating P-type ATPase [Bryobacter sp.]|nr:heavy metal translocating P-type ATPase [Bryobacter sp.]
MRTENILFFATVAAALPLLFRIGRELLRGNWSTDLIAAVSICSAIYMQQYPVAWIVMLMLTGGAWLESYAVKRSSRALTALAKRVPTIAHRLTDGQSEEVALDAVAIGDTLLVHPHEICPADGVVQKGRGTMDESFLTGEPYQVEKAPGVEVISGARNGNSLLEISVSRKPEDSRYARIMQVLADTELRRPRVRRLGDQIGAWYSPLALLAALAAWGLSGDANRFLAVIVVATPCPLLIAIPVALIGSIAKAARQGIIIRDPAVLELTPQVRNFLFDKTGTLTHGEPKLTQVLTVPELNADQALILIASLERYSKHPLAAPLLAAAAERNLPLEEVEHLEELPGQGLRAVVQGRRYAITSRKHAALPASFAPLPPGHLEAILTRDSQAIASFQFRDVPRPGTRSFLAHLAQHHGSTRVVLVTGDQLAAAQELAQQVGIAEVRAAQSPEEKVAFVRELTATAPTLYLGDGINDAPALAAATVGVAFGKSNVAPAEAAGAVILEPSLRKVDELLHLAIRLRRILLESVLGGLALSVAGMVLAAFGYLPALYGALLQEAIDVLSVVNALRTSLGSDPNDYTGD